MGVGLLSSGRFASFKSCDFTVEFQAELCGFFFRQPMAHLRKNRTVKAQASSVPWQGGRGADFRKNTAQPHTNSIGIGPKGLRSLFFGKRHRFSVGEGSLVHGTHTKAGINEPTYKSIH